MVPKPVRLSLVLLVLLSAFLLPRRSEANCFYPRSRTITYYAWIDDAYPTWYSCTYIIISPPWQAHWGVIGEKTTECDGSVSEWGDTTTCTGSSNTQSTSNACEPICE